MGLVTCQDCGAQVSTKATACPKCGCPTTAPATPENTSEAAGGAAQAVVDTEVSPPRTRRKGKGVVVGALVVVVVGAATVGGYFYVSAKEEERRQAEATARAEAEKKAAQEAETRRLELEAAARRQAEELRAREEEAARQREQAERQSIASDPGSVLEASNFQFYDKGFINSYRQLSGVSVLNKSKYPLRRLSGQVEWLTENGGFVGATPFSLSGSIPAGDTKDFSTRDGTLESGTIQGEASRARLKFSPAEIVE